MSNKEVDWQLVFTRVNKHCSDYNDRTVRVQNELLADLRTKGLKTDRRKFNQWVTSGILSPTPPKGPGYPEYHLSEIRKAFLAAELYHTYELRPGEIKIAVQLHSSKPWDEIPALHVRDLNQGQRARLLLTGRILGVVGAVALRQKKTPSDTIIICLENFDTNTFNHHATIARLSEDSVKAVLVPQTSLIGWTDEGQVDEVFSVMGDPKVIENRLSGRAFYSIQVKAEDRRQFQLIFGPREGSALSYELQDKVLSTEGYFESSSPESKLIARLLTFSFPNLVNLEDALWNELPNSRLHESASLLSILVTSTLLGSANHWSSAGFYAYEGGDTLYLRDYSPRYPVNLYPNNIGLRESEGPLAWVFRNRAHLLVERPLEGAFLLSGPFAELAASHAFIPAIQGTGCAGVLHVVGTTTEVLADKCFPVEQVELLFILSRIIGEAHFRNVVASVQGVSKLVPITQIIEYDLEGLRTSISNILGNRVAPILNKDAILPSQQAHYIVFFAVRLKQTLTSLALRKYCETIQQRAFDCLHQDIEDFTPSIYRLTDEQFVIVIPEMNESEIRRLRVRLQGEFDEINNINPQVSTECAVWSIHIPYKYLESNFGIGLRVKDSPDWQESCTMAVEDLISRTRAALEVIWQVKAADIFLRHREYTKALSMLEDALILDEQNSYIWRHIAEAKTELGDYVGAVEAAKKAIQFDQKRKTKFASNHRRLAEAYLGMGKLDDAFDQFEEAYNISKNPLYREVLIQHLILYGNEDNWKYSLRLIMAIEPYFSQDNSKERAWLERLRGEAYLRLENRVRALEAFYLAARLQPDEKFIDWDIARARKHE